MHAQNGAEKASTSSQRPWQFGLKHLLLLPLGTALGLGFFTWLYPFSRMMLPVLLFSVMVAVLSYLVHGGRYGTLFQNVVAACVVYVLWTILASGYVDTGDSSARLQCCNNLKQIMLALHNYHQDYGCFPPACVADRSGRPMHSWRVLILPYLEQNALYNRYRFDEPWNGPNNQRLWTASVPQYECPKQPSARTWMTSYVAVVGAQTMWPGTSCTRFQDIRDGSSKTIVVVEIADSGIRWLEPRDLELSTMSLSVNSNGGQGISSRHCYTGWPQRPLGANAAVADGSVRFLSNDASAEQTRAWLTIAGGETAADDWAH